MSKNKVDTNEEEFKEYLKESFCEIVRIIDKKMPKFKLTDKVEEETDDGQQSTGE